MHNDDVPKEGDVLMDACRNETGIVDDNMGWLEIAQSPRRRETPWMKVSDTLEGNAFFECVGTES